MKFSKPFTSSSSMPAFSAHTGSATASQSSAPPSALDIVQGQGVHSWDSLLSPMVEASSTLPQDDSELMDSPSFILGGSPDFETTSASSTALATATGVAEPFSWDISSLSSTHLRPSGPTVGDVHTATASLPHNGTQPTAPTAFTSTYPLLPLDSTTYSNYPYGSYPLLPVLSATPYELASVSGRTQVIPEEAPATVSPAAVSLSQVAPPSRVETRPTKISTPTITTPAPVMKQETVLAQTLYSREASMDIDDDVEGEYDDDDDLEDEDAGDEYKERSRGGRKDAKIGRPAAISAPRKAEASSIETSTAKKGKNAGKQSSGSENGTPAPAKRRGGTRISVADFVPPDVTGLSKREARLVKNRAAAFLSRQRKREEFELMEVRLAEILEENARLKGEAPGTPSASAPVSDEVQRLQEMLRDAQEREQALKAQLEEQTRLAEQSRLQAAIKAEEPSMTVQEALKLASPMIQSPRSDISSLDGSVFSSALKEKDSSRHSGPGFNLMVLVFSLTMLSMPHQHQLQSMRGAGAQPTRIMYEPSGSATSSAFPSLFENVLERWEGANKIESVDGIEPVDEDDEMEVEVEPWEQDEAPADQTKSGNSYVVDFEMPVLADQVGKDEDGKIKVRISPVGVPRPRKANGGLKQGELAWGGSPLPPLETSTSTFASDWETWGGWKEFLSDDVVATTYPSLVSDVPSISIEEALSPSSEMEQSVVVDDNSSERWATPPPFPTEGEETPSDATLATVLSGEQQPQGPVDVDVSLSTLPAWSRALVQAAAGEKLKARIRVSKKSRMGRSKNTLSLGKKKMGLVVKV